MLLIVVALVLAEAAAPYNGAPFLRSSEVAALPSAKKDEEDPNVEVQRQLPNVVNSGPPTACDLGANADKGKCLSVSGRECMWVHLESFNPLLPVQATESHCMPCEMDGEAIPCWNVGAVVSGKRVMECEMRCAHQTRVRVPEYACSDETGFITASQCLDKGTRSGSKCMWMTYEVGGITKSTCGPCDVTGTGALSCPANGQAGPEPDSTMTACVSQCAVICHGPPDCPPTVAPPPPLPPPSPGVPQTSSDPGTMLLAPVPLALPTPNPYAIAMQAMEAAKAAGWAIGTPPPPKAYDPVILYRRPLDYMFTPGPPPSMIAAPAPPGAFVEKVSLRGRSKRQLPAPTLH